MPEAEDLPFIFRVILEAQLHVFDGVVRLEVSPPMVVDTVARLYRSIEGMNKIRLSFRFVARNKGNLLRLIDGIAILICSTEKFQFCIIRSGSIALFVGFRRRLSPVKFRFIGNVSIRGEINVVELEINSSNTSLGICSRFTIEPTIGNFEITVS